MTGYAALAAAGDPRGEPTWHRPDSHPARAYPREVATIGLDIAETSVHFVGPDTSGQVLTRRQYLKTKPLVRHWRQSQGHVPVFVDGTGVDVAGRQFKGTKVGYSGQRQYWLRSAFVGGWGSCPDGRRTITATRLPSSPVELFELALRVARGLQADAINEAEQAACPLSIVLVLLVRSKDEPSDQSGLPAIVIVDAISLLR